MISGGMVKRFADNTARLQAGIKYKKEEGGGWKRKGGDGFVRIEWIFRYGSMGWTPLCVLYSTVPSKLRSHSTDAVSG